MMAFINALALRSEGRHRWSINRRRFPPTLCSRSEEEGLVKVWVCTSSTCRGNSLLSTMRALVSSVEASIEPTGCLGECGNGPNVAVETHDSVRVSIEKHIDSVEQAVKLLKRLKFDVNEEILRAAVEKEKGDFLMLKGTEANAGEHYERAIDSLKFAKLSSNKWVSQYKIAILCNWAQSLVKISAHERALLLVNKAIEMQPENIAAWKWKAQAHEGLRQFHTAKQCWEMWGKLSGRIDEARKQINRFTGWRAWFS